MATENIGMLSDNFKIHVLENNNFYKVIRKQGNKINRIMFHLGLKASVKNP